MRQIVAGLGGITVKHGRVFHFGKQCWVIMLVSIENGGSYCVL
ncbi:hypothetical protein C8N30_0267 [Sulfitobacter guttiformis]|uniref:Uncharacterized protein n=1 Tax=Sulfitobacter guttiformis TaxID=74349 RepID=A0A420DNE9_9RHOB|nr:hypothetical protein C8N30_0267 [Sulfitobacter guttiformis]